MGKGPEVGPSTGPLYSKALGFSSVATGSLDTADLLWESVLDGGQAGDSSAALGVASGFSLDL